MPKFLERNQARQVDTAKTAIDAEGRTLMHGMGTSSGEVTATARVIRSLADVGRVNKGDILITNSTDPGWTPIFAVLSGVIVETGGLLSHSGCLAREYGFPAAHIEDTVAQIPDGATITLNGSEGWVRIEHQDSDTPAGDAATVPAGAEGA
jgi:pyruvate,water dikinase